MGGVMGKRENVDEDLRDEFAERRATRHPFWETGYSLLGELK